MALKIKVTNGRDPSKLIQRNRKRTCINVRKRLYIINAKVLPEEYCKAGGTARKNTEII